MPEPLAECADVGRVFGRFTAVDGVSLAVDPGEVVGLLGANGAGKTTLIRMLLGLLPVSAGSVRLFGLPPSRASRRRIGYLPQGLGLYDDLTIAENLAFSRSVFSGRSKGTAVPDALQRYAGVCVRDVPLGVARRAAFAQALAHEPDLLLLDEPTSGVDPLARARLWETIAEAASAGAGVIVTTHNMEEAGECSRLIVLAAGRVVAEGTVAQIVADRRTAVVRSADWPATMRLLEAVGLHPVLAGAAEARVTAVPSVTAVPPVIAAADVALRVQGASAGQVTRAVANTAASVSEEPATLEERFFQLAESGAESGAGAGPEAGAAAR